MAGMPHIDSCAAKQKHLHRESFAPWLPFCTKMPDVLYPHCHQIKGATGIIVTQGQYMP